MSARHVKQHYGFGAARIAVRAEMHRPSQAGLADDFGAMFAEAGSGGMRAVVRRFAGTAAGLVGIAAFLGVMITTLVADEASREALEVVMLESAEAVPPPIVPPMVELAPEPEPIAVEPPAPEPIPEPAPVVPEPPPMVAEVKPPPPPPVVPKPEPVRVLPEIAKVEPPPVVRPERAVRERQAPPVAKPRVAIESVAVAPVVPDANRAPERVARAATRPDARAMPRVASLAAPAADLPSDSTSERSFRVATARAASAPRGRNLPGVAPAAFAAPAAPSMDMPAAQAAPTRSAPARPTPAGGSARSVPRLEMAAAPVAQTAAVRDVPQVVARSERAVPPPGAGASSATSTRPGLSGVPLGELSACVTDREEDRLKQAVVAAVKAQSECVSSKGTYRFVETKNLNAFLMWIDRAPSRRVEDRCAELRYALECLQGGQRRAAR